jgi:hypothetical protein
VNRYRRSSSPWRRPRTTRGAKFSSSHSSATRTSGPSSTASSFRHPAHRSFEDDWCAAELATCTRPDSMARPSRLPYASCRPNDKWPAPSPWVRAILCRCWVRRRRCLRVVVVEERVTNAAHLIVRGHRLVVRDAPDRADQGEQLCPAVTGWLWRWCDGFHGRSPVESRWTVEALAVCSSSSGGRLLTDCKRTVQQRAIPDGMGGLRSTGKAQVKAQLPDGGVPGDTALA